MFHIRILPAATRELEGLDKSIARRIAQRIRWLAANLDNIRPEQFKADLAGFYKLRAGDYRVVYEILHDERRSLSSTRSDIGETSIESGSTER